MHRAAADAASLQDADGHVGGRAAAGVLEEARQHVVLALVEVARRGVGPLFERDDVEPGARELAQGHGPTGAGPDDDRVDVEHDVLVEVAPGTMPPLTSPLASHSRGGPTSGPS